LVFGGELLRGGENHLLFFGVTSVSNEEPLLPLDLVMDPTPPDEAAGDFFLKMLSSEPIDVPARDESLPRFKIDPFPSTVSGGACFFSAFVGVW
jgi:hypothetical protein